MPVYRQVYFCDLNYMYDPTIYLLFLTYTVCLVQKRKIVILTFLAMVFLSTLLSSLYRRRNMPQPFYLNRESRYIIVFSNWMAQVAKLSHFDVLSRSFVVIEKWRRTHVIVDVTLEILDMFRFPTNASCNYWWWLQNPENWF